VRVLMTAIVLVPGAVRGIVRMVVLVMVGLLHRKPGRRYARAKDTFRGEIVSRHQETAQRTLQVVERKAGIKKGAKDHVA
jgi:hypothetical protein